MEKCVDVLKAEFHLKDEDLATLQFNLFVLKMMPLYTGLEPRKMNDNPE